MGQIHVPLSVVLVVTLALPLNALELSSARAVSRRTLLQNQKSSVVPGEAVEQNAPSWPSWPPVPHPPWPAWPQSPKLEKSPPPPSPSPPPPSAPNWPSWPSRPGGRGTAHGHGWPPNSPSPPPMLPPISPPPSPPWNFGSPFAPPENQPEPWDQWDKMVGQNATDMDQDLDVSAQSVHAVYFKPVGEHPKRWATTTNKPGSATSILRNLLAAATAVSLVVVPALVMRRRLSRGSGHEPDRMQLLNLRQAVHDYGSTSVTSGEETLEEGGESSPLLGDSSSVHNAVTSI